MNDLYCIKRKHFKESNMPAALIIFVHTSDIRSFSYISWQIATIV